MDGRGVVCEDVAIATGAENDLLVSEVADYEVVDAVGAIGVASA